MDFNLQVELSLTALDRRLPKMKSTYAGRFPFNDSRASCSNPYTKLIFNPNFAVRAAV